MKLKARLMDEAAMNRALMRISHEIIEKNKGVENVVLVGIRRRGVPIAERICRFHQSESNSGIAGINP